MALTGSRFARTAADLNWDYLDNLINDIDGQTSRILKKERRKLAERVEALKHGLDAAITSTRIQVYKLEDDCPQRRALQRSIDFLESLRRGSVRVRTRAVLGSRSGKKGKARKSTPSKERRSMSRKRTKKRSSDMSPRNGRRHAIPKRSPRKKRNSSVDVSACVTSSSDCSNDSSYRGDLILRIPKSRITSGIFGFESGDFIEKPTPVGKKSQNPTNASVKRVRKSSFSSVFEEPEPQKRERPPGVYQLRKVVSSGHVCTKCLGCNGKH
ncbi:PREDICTED: uncharacterized protein LOC109468667 [Branchiostoma belcheri]|uniref:Uncharacterized protein LOC109468667 n=1 Tax=Branchiostoma belcheri TaxID=7741 RepID=A0A6P4YDN3_BRABE|nr:PREDICTED: uncharacterized protein LOC109468667 [Branchiostoma belcheri]